VFDCVTPYGMKVSERQVRARLTDAVAASYPEYYCVITMEHGFTGAHH